MPWTEVVMTTAIAAAIALVLVALVRLWGTMVTHNTLRKAIETKPELTEGLLEKLTAKRERSGDDKLALVLIAIGVAMALAVVIASDDPGDIRAGIAAALFPLLVGGALWLRFRAVQRAKLRDRAE